ncbi:TPA: transposase family protein [Escherichia albertii]|nr:transposase family protein [Escherichia albertii]
MSLSRLLEYISVIPDYRQQGKIDHKLMDILFLTVCAVMSGAEGWDEICDFGHAHINWLKMYGNFKNGSRRGRITASRRMRTMSTATMSTAGWRRRRTVSRKG